MDDLCERLEGLVDSGKRTLGGGHVTADGKSAFWGCEPIMVLRNPDGPEAAARIRQLEAEVGGFTTRAHSIAPVDDALSTEAPVSLKTDGDVQLPLKVDDADVRAMAIEGKFALINWQKYNGDQSDEVVYQAEKMATALRNLLSRLSASGVGHG